MMGLKTHPTPAGVVRRWGWRVPLTERWEGFGEQGRCARLSGRGRRVQVGVEHSTTAFDPLSCMEA